MTSMEQVLLEASKRGVVFFLKDDRLSYRAKKGAVDEAFQTGIKRYRAQIEDYLRQQELSPKTAKTFTLPPVPQADRNQPLQLSYAQQRLWFIDQFGGSSVHYNMPGHILMTGDFNVEAFKRALQQLILRHEILRTRFIAEAGEARLCIETDFELPFEYSDISQLDEQQRQRLVDQWMTAEATKPFDLAGDLMIRVKLIKLDANAHLILYTVHHIASDGWSQGILQNELSQLYKAFCHDEPNPLTPLQIQYVDYAAWQRNWLQGDLLAQQLEYWKKQLAELPAIHSLPLDKPRPMQQTFAGKVYNLQLDGAKKRQLATFCQNHNVTLFMLLHSAFALLLHRYSNETDIVIGSTIAGRSHQDIESVIGIFINTLILRSDFSRDVDFATYLHSSKRTVLEAHANQHIPFEMLVEVLQPQRHISYSPLVQVAISMQNNERGAFDKQMEASGQQSQVQLQRINIKLDMELYVKEQGDGLVLGLGYNQDLFADDTIVRMSANLAVLLDSILASTTKTKLSDLALLTAEQELKLLRQWNNFASDGPMEQCIHQLFESQAQNQGDALAVIDDKVGLSYLQLNARSNQLAHYLRSQGIGPGDLVGVCLQRNVDMVIALLGIFKCGGAYVPLDPNYPKARLQHMISDSGCKTVISQAQIIEFLDDVLPPLRICIDRPTDHDLDSQCEQNLASLNFNSSMLAYVIYTSGSTGKPKGVMVKHQNAVNLFRGLDHRLGREARKNWLAVTSINFDISVLELFWTLVNGDTVILQSQRTKVEGSSRDMDFSLFYFAAEQMLEKGNKYHLLLEGAKFADQHDLSAIWVPERHFHSFGDPFPNPSVAAAAAAAVTKNIKLRAGSVVLPLHDTIRVAEEWSMVDNISQGRVELSVASGWHPNDFVLAPENFECRHEALRNKITELNDLWTGKGITRTNGKGTKVDIELHPKPIQAKLPLWITAANSPETFRYAGSIGANVLTHLLGQSKDELKEKIDIYRQSLADHGFKADKGKVALMLHTFVGEDMAQVKAIVDLPFKNYLRQSIGLIAPLAKAAGLDLQKDQDVLIDMGFERFFKEGGLMGTLDSCAAQVQELQAIGIDECACLIDFGVDHQQVIDSLPLLAQLQRRIAYQSKKNRFNQLISASSSDLVDNLVKHRVSHLQCTPTYARELLATVSQQQQSLHSLQTICVGGEAFPTDLAAQLTQLKNLRVYNMYGPTETTVWSTIAEINGQGDKSAPLESVSIGQPIHDTQVYVVDNGLNLCPIGVIGELLIAGSGVTDGYLNRPDLTAERFIPNPFGNKAGTRLYRTGDLVSWDHDGSLRYSGRLDSQVKVRGFRIELGEIEQVLIQHENVHMAAVLVTGQSPHDLRIEAFAVGDVDPQQSEQLRNFVKNQLPDYMVPSSITVLPKMPMTENGKIDRNGLLAMDRDTYRRNNYVEPSSNTERLVAKIWAELLNVPLETVGVNDSFFDLGGHSLLAIKLVSQINIVMNSNIELADIFRLNRLGELAQHIESTLTDGDRPRFIEALGQNTTEQQDIDEFEL